MSADTRATTDELPEECEVLLMPHEVAEKLRVNPRTVTNWAKRGKIRFICTPGGHRRYPEGAVTALREGRLEDAAPRNTE